MSLEAPFSKCKRQTPGAIDSLFRITGSVCSLPAVAGEEFSAAATETASIKAVANIVLNIALPFEKFEESDSYNSVFCIACMDTIMSVSYFTSSDSKHIS